VPADPDLRQPKGPWIREAGTAEDFALARALFIEYAAWLGVDLCFQGFAAELARLPGCYAPPGGRLLLAGVDATAAGCIALRPLSPADVPDECAAEVKRLYVRLEARGRGLGAMLVAAVIAAARDLGYRTLKLDTLPQMPQAQKLYRRYGFRPCVPYYHNPLPGAVYMALDLRFRQPA
jgi:putative acetyltransferase